MTTSKHLILKSGRDKAALNKHPWIFSGAVKILPKAEDGEIVAVADNHNQVIGYGFFAPNSQIICRIFHFGNDLPDFSSIDFWMNKFNQAIRLRKNFISPDTNAFRLIHAEGDFLPGIIVDIYNKIAVIQLLIKGTERLAPLFVNCLERIGYQYVYFKSKSSSARFENIVQPSGWLTESTEYKTEILEHGLKFLVDVETGQKTGFFIDQRENRLLLKMISDGKKVLNTFCYTGGFSVYALAGGASEVCSVDISKTAIQLCEETISLNFTKTLGQHKSLDADCFDYLRNLDTTYDIIVLDPPAFAKNARSVPNASRGYKDLNLLAFRKIAPGGMVMTYSCSQNIDKDLFQKIVFSAAADAGRNVRIIRHLGQPEDHPINIFHPESEYLKGLLLWVE